MDARDDLHLLERFSRIERRAHTRPWLSALLSLCVPGLGQGWIGQYRRGLRLFAGSAVLLFGCGLCNLFVAADAWRIASKLQHDHVDRDQSTFWLKVPAFLWEGALRLTGFDALRDTLRDGL